MENFNNPFKAEDDAPVVEETIVETPAEETTVVESPVVEDVAPESVKAEEAPETEEPTAIKTSDFGRSKAEPQAVGSVENGAIGTTTAPKPAAKPSKKAAKSEKEETVAVHSTKNVTWAGVGKVYRGYNIVTKSAADKWLTRPHIRIATPEEVAKEFGK